MNIPDIFPSLKNKKAREVNLNDEARIYLWIHGFMDETGNWRQENPLIHAEACSKFVTWVHEKYGVDFSYGGYGEDRSTLWHDTYLDTLGSHFHLGVDINVPSGTEIISPISGRVILSDHDRDYPEAPQYHGWGNRLIIRPEESEYDIILAHLSDTTKRKVGSLVEKGEPIGTIGTSQENGGWFEHFHLQKILRKKLNELFHSHKIAELDGYARSMDDSIKHTYPYPLSITR